MSVLEFGSETPLNLELDRLAQIAVWCQSFEFWFSNADQMALLTLLLSNRGHVI